jgi:hypothetical protein
MNADDPQSSAEALLNNQDIDQLKNRTIATSETTATIAT